MKSNVLKTFDHQLLRYSPKLRDDLNITPSESNHVATTVFNEISQVSSEDKNMIGGALLRGWRFSRWTPPPNKFEGATRKRERLQGLN